MPWKWNIDATSFVVLLGEDEELNFRRARRRLCDVLSLAPVSGLQAYLRNYSTLMEAQDKQQYISPYGMTKRQIRSIRCAQMLSRCGLLANGTITFCTIASSPRKGRQVIGLCWLMTVCSWLSFAALVAVSFYSKSTTWVGISNVATLALWSVYVRALDVASFAPVETRPPFPDKLDSAIFLGQDNSAFIIEGRRRDIVQWTGAGLGYRRMHAAWLRFLALLRDTTRIGTFALLVFIVCTIPNGSDVDRIIFFAYNVLGQFNTRISLHLHAQRTLLDLQDFKKIGVPSRTHVYAEILRRGYPEGNWAKDVGLLPKGKVWEAWRSFVVDHRDVDPKELWEQISERQSRDLGSPRMRGGSPS
ncbi:hypothetical protein GGS26DRAFT_571784 [Hypomontagnella submonticulosa]|nr:hypothetical protein GGS26DRAFT_571784 [Hypomontagnella submonticulosa]